MSQDKEKLDDVIWLARCIYSETKRPKEMRLVAWAVRNRKDTGYRGKNTYKDVVLDPWQYSAFNKQDPKRKFHMSLEPGDDHEMWDEALEIAREVAEAPAEDNPIPEVRHYYSPRSMRPPGAVPSWAEDAEVAVDMGLRFKFLANVA